MMKARLLLIINTFFVSALMVGCASNQPTSSKAAIATSHPLATQAGFRALDQGGNAFDAAVAASSVLSVVSPYAAGLGGGSFWLLQKRNGSTTFIDAREVSPQQGISFTDLNAHSFLEHPLSAAIPGQPAALAHVSKHYGIRPLAANLSDALHLATRGFRVDKQYERYASLRLNALRNQPNSLYLNQGSIPNKGTIIKQPELAETLIQLGRKGHNGFYQGDVANRLVSDITRAGGTWTLQDLQSYAIVERPAISFAYKEAIITTSPPPSYGGIALQQTLKILERFDTDQMTRVEQIDLLSPIMRWTNPSTATWLGDPEFSKQPIEQLTSGSYLSYLAGNIAENKTIDINTPPSKPLSDGEVFTPHISIVDKWGNKASLSLSMNMSFGSTFTSQTTGVLLNNSLANFSTNSRPTNSPLSTNGTKTIRNKGFLAPSSNAPAPSKRPLSFMTPTLVETANSSAIIGVSSGNQTLTALIFTVLDYMNNEPINRWSRGLKYHYNAQSGHLELAPSTLSDLEQNTLNNLGHSLESRQFNPTDIQVIRTDKMTGNIEASSGSAGSGQAIVR
ncbi:gamma-glutamyltransferase family protein [Alkalimarinus alittae]|uniref:Gamma-glutamyltransferase n=1 Tax=Alkalimarinus alittae TaxID=2961619 RepID=A0ABY6N0M5_9ALTE|nr:gamma-glutamyltransferase [Alkalimarinus alittae]UZE95651.1 gamma-glutamyltransferase [Alkalimarinus alittae]